MDLQQLLYDLYNAKNSESVYNVVEKYCLDIHMEEIKTMQVLLKTSNLHRKMR